MRLHNAKVSFNELTAGLHKLNRMAVEQNLAAKNVSIKLRPCGCVHCLLSRSVSK